MPTFRMHHFFKCNTVLVNQIEIVEEQGQPWVPFDFRVLV